MHADDIDRCLEISNAVFGANYHHPIYFDLKNTKHHYFVVEYKKQLIGFSILYKVPKNEMQKITSDSFPLNSDFYYLIDVIAIQKNKQKMGAGSSVLKKMLNIVNKEYPIYSIGWKDINGINIKKLYENNNINPIVNLGKIWAYGCNHKFQCPSYNKHCQCEGLLFKLTPC